MDLEEENEMDEGEIIIGSIPHLFLPKKLPPSEQDEIVEIEEFLLETVFKSVSKAGGEVNIPKMDEVIEMFQIWELLQGKCNGIDGEENVSVSYIDTIFSDRSKVTIPFYLRKQNCTLLLEREESPGEPACFTVECYRSSLPNKVVMGSTTNELIVEYPEISAPVVNKGLLTSTMFPKMLYELCTSTLEVSTPNILKNGGYSLDTRDATEPFLITNWLVGLLHPVFPKDKTRFPKISKKIRDTVFLQSTQGSSALLPFRRSGLWTSLKITLQLKLSRLFGDQSKALYKVLMLRILTEVCEMYFNLRGDYQLDFDLIAQMLSKIGRRVVKLQSLSFSTEADSDISLMGQTNRLREVTIDYIYETLRKMDKFMNESLRPEIERVALTPLGSRSKEKYVMDLNHYIPWLDDCQKRLLSQKGSPPPEDMNTPADFQRSLELCRYPNVDAILTEAKSKTLEVDGIKLKLWLHDTETFLKSSPLLPTVDSTKIYNVLKAYIPRARAYLQNAFQDDNPLVASQLLLSVLKAVEALDRRAAFKHPLLLKYRSGIDPQLFDKLVLPQMEDIRSLEEALEYFRARNKAASIKHGSILGEKLYPNSVSVKYVDESQELLQILHHVRGATEIAIKNMLKKVEKQKQICKNLHSRFLSLEKTLCSCEKKQIPVTSPNGQTTYKTVTAKQCEKCNVKFALRKKRQSLKLLELPLPTEEYLQKGVIFELYIPLDLLALRDSLAILRCGLLSDSTSKYVAALKENLISVEWGTYKNLQEYLPTKPKPTALQKPRVLSSIMKFGSTCLSYASTHFVKKNPDLVTISKEQMICDNGLQCIYQFSTKNMPALDSPLPQITFQIKGTRNIAAYLPLQRYLESWEHSQNAVICDQYKCHQDLSFEEFVAFGSLRAGHRIQVRNLYRAIASGTLHLEEEPVLALILQTIWQVGPNNSEAHDDFKDDPFSIEFLNLLKKIMEANKSNYSNVCVLIAAVAITVKIMAMNESCWEPGLDLLESWRDLLRDWMSRVQIHLENQHHDESFLKELKRLSIRIQICAAFSYNFSAKIKWSEVIRRKEDAVQWFHGICTLGFQDDGKYMTKFMRILINYGRNAAFHLKLEDDAVGNQLLGEALKTFAQEKWNRANACQSFPAISWKMKEQNNLVELKYIEEICQGSAVFPKVFYVTFDLILGTFLVNGWPTGKLPLEITEKASFLKFFGKAGKQMEVQPESTSVFRTANKYFGGRHYEFQLTAAEKMSRDGKSNLNVQIKEIQDDGSYLILLEPKEFSGFISPNFVNGYSHWFDVSRGIVYFRKVCSDVAKGQLEHEYRLISFTYTFNKVWKLFDTRNNGFLLFVKSEGFKNICKSLVCLEIERNVTVVRSEGPVLRLTAYLPRYNLRFRMNDRLSALESVEYPGYFVDPSHWGTLVGLQQGIQLKNGEKKILLLPHGDILLEGANPEEFQHKTLISLEKLYQPPYFVYRMDQVLKRIVGNYSKLPYIYLAALHAVTSLVSGQPDPYTNITGIESAVRILQSGFIWSSSPYDLDCLRILQFIRRISPVRSFYGHKFLRKVKHQNAEKTFPGLEQVTWMSEYLPSLSAYDGYAIIVDKLISDSERLSVLHGVELEKEKEEKPESYENLRLRSYLRHQKSYNTLAHVSDINLKGILETRETEPPQDKIKLTRPSAFRIGQLLKVIKWKAQEKCSNFKPNSLKRFLFATYDDYLATEDSL